MPTRRVGRQVAGPDQHNRLIAQSQWFATVLSGSTTLSRHHDQAGSYSATAAWRQRRGPPVSHRYRPSDATAPRRTTDQVQGAKRQDQTYHAVEDIIYYSYLLCRTTYGLTYLEATYRVSELIITIRP
jgi:hypothetical protein